MNRIIDIALAPETADSVQVLKQSAYKDKTFGEMFCEIIAIGIQAAKEGEQ